MATLARNVVSATVAGGKMSNVDVLPTPEDWDLGSEETLFYLPLQSNGVSVSLSWGLGGGRGGGWHRISLFLPSLSKFSKINVSSFAKFLKTISRDFNLVVF